MEDFDLKMEQHYLKEGLYEDICNRLIEQGINLANVSRADIAGVDEFHVRGAAVSHELANSIPLQGLKVLDIGCGLGGPCRMLASEYNCDTTGIDLSSEYIRTATKLSALVNLEPKTNFIKANALELPFKNESFDVVWTQHVQMNISDKRRFYSEMKRVLRPGGHFLCYDIFKKEEGAVSYPMPWASNERQSFLFNVQEMTQLLSDLNFEQLQSNDQTEAGLLFFENVFAKIKEFGPPKIGLNVLMGESALPKLMNLQDHLERELLALHSGVFKKTI